MFNHLQRLMKIMIVIFATFCYGVLILLLFMILFILILEFDNLNCGEILLIGHIHRIDFFLIMKDIIVILLLCTVELNKLTHQLCNSISYITSLVD